ELDGLLAVDLGLREVARFHELRGQAGPHQGRLRVVNAGGAVALAGPRGVVIEGIGLAQAEMEDGGVLSVRWNVDRAALTGATAPAIGGLGHGRLLGSRILGPWNLMQASHMAGWLGGPAGAEQQR